MVDRIEWVYNSKGYASKVKMGLTCFVHYSGVYGDGFVPLHFLACLKNALPRIGRPHLH